MKKTLCFFTACMVVAPSFAQVELTSRAGHYGNYDWQITRCGDISAGGENVSLPGFKTDKWIDAIVPGTVLTSFVNAGVYPDPYFGMNNKISEDKIPDISKVGRDFYTYWWRNEFDIPEYMKGKTIWIESQGVNYRAEVWVNGRLVDTMNGMFKGDYIDITDYVRSDGPNGLAFKVLPVDMPGAVKPKDWGAKGEFRNGGDKCIRIDVLEKISDLAPTMMRFHGENITILTMK